LLAYCAAPLKPSGAGKRRPRSAKLTMPSGIELALSSKLHEHKGGDLFLALLMAAIGVALNPAAAFAVGLPIAYALQHDWIRV